MAVVWLLIDGTGLETHDTPDGIVSHQLSGNSQLLLASLLLANLGLLLYLQFNNKRQAALWFGLGAMLPMFLLLRIFFIS